VDRNILHTRCVPGFWLLELCQSSNNITVRRYLPYARLTAHNLTQFSVPAGWVLNTTFNLEPYRDPEVAKSIIR
jgi:hypothetical protein